ncbi:MAG: N-acetyltransferase [Rhodospirillaceae bacterium]|jgi:putative acetyltransferase|nr:N-acetyltransferase [Rhodospirillaceae bacterium]MBT4588116.1 N-acetyltransferase [Rhodospirillaceae bacterium]MBT4938829.1 N-acetyltransferase [Rhodospirillaceae bacterium]MBT7268469.1 N-acetyltransferase [Rhodospirillaceae bacterium]
MKVEIKYRDSKSSDLASIEKLYPEAFPDEDLVPLVSELLQETSDILSLVAYRKASLVGHVIFTRCRISNNSNACALLGPLAVDPARQGQGIGSAIVRLGLERLVNVGVSDVFVLGDPAYYVRFGFQPRAGVEAPYTLPEEWREAWQSLSLTDEASSLKGKLLLPQPWLNPSLWIA